MLGLLLSGKCDRLADEEARTPQRQPLRAYGDFDEHPEKVGKNGTGIGPHCLLQVSPYGEWEYRDQGVSADLTARFRLLATQGGTVLNAPNGEEENSWRSSIHPGRQRLPNEQFQ